MNNPGAALLLVFFILETKHFLCDYPLQRPYQVENKGTYGHPGGFIHAGLHVIGTLFTFLVITPSFWIGLGIVVVEFVIHYHIDWAKQQVMARTRWTVADGNYWLALGVDQYAHQLTYVAIAAVLWMTM